MPLTLDSSTLRRFRRTSTALLSPLDHPDSASWCDDVLRSAEALFGADRSMMLMPDGDQVLVWSRTLPPEALAYYRRLPETLGPGEFRARAPDVDRVLRRRRTARLEVWSNAALHRLAAMPMTKSPFFQEVLVPAGLVHGRGLAVSLPRGEAWLSLAHSRPDRDPLGEERGMALLELVLPAFKAGLHAFGQLHAHRATLGRVADRLSQPLFLFDTDGALLHRNRACRRLLATDPEGERIGDEARRMAMAVGRLVDRQPSKTRPTSEPTPAAATVATPNAAYRIEGALLREGALARRPCVLVSVRSLAPRLPTESELSARYDLTPREAQVTRLLAAGHSNRRIARSLGISPNTVATHAESIFRKLGIHTRKGLGLRLMRDGDRPG